MKQQNTKVRQELQDLSDFQKQANDRLAYLLRVVMPMLSETGPLAKSSFEV